MSRPRWPSFAGWRDTTLFLVGLALIVNEAVLRQGPERPTFLVLYGAMVGLPAFLRLDERRQQPSERNGKEGPTP